MQINITDQEKEYLLELIELSNKELLIEINRADALDYKDMLRNKQKTLDGLMAKLKSSTL
jgi:hypothetical protein